MAPEPSETQPELAGDHSPDRRLTDAYHRDREADPELGLSFVLRFGDTAYQCDFRRGDSQALMASRLRELADRLTAG